MAKINLILASVFVFVLLFSYRITFTEGRLLKVDKLDGPGNVDMTNVVTHLNRDILEEASSAGHVKGTTTAAAYRYDDFQSTTPAHSPGAGHATGPSGNNNK
ncbi:hypothetical protein CXB51_005470 [Gossypium anomalum]|uniref:Uncharacterized protein n=1 Tax=Gossypium anomalum TaxID=47600 RepID=A0A8J5Z156_9ROSI|nr:hypothetical protein CXB51_005470 [Gossypium anomalum]